MRIRLRWFGEQLLQSAKRLLWPRTTERLGYPFQITLSVTDRALGTGWVGFLGSALDEYERRTGKTPLFEELHYERVRSERVASPTSYTIDIVVVISGRIRWAAVSGRGEATTHVRQLARDIAQRAIAPFADVRTVSTSRRIFAQRAMRQKPSHLSLVIIRNEHSDVDEATG